MATFFEAVFPEVEFNYEGDTQVCCPFPHSTLDGKTYYETNPSAGINLVKNVFHCFSCQRAYNETGFIAAYMNTTYANAAKIKELIHRATEDENDWKYAHDLLMQNPTLQKQLKDLHISKKVIKELQLGEENQGIAFPVFLFGQLVDVRVYRPGKRPKVTSRKGATSGLIIPFDLWRKSEESTLICAGEKDMAIARSLGFNAITITGGERKIPHLFLSQFKDRRVYIVYDNDSTGREGARQLAMHLRPFTDQIKIIDLSDVCVNEGEDLWDYFVKYKKTPKDFVKKVLDTPWFSEQDYQEEVNKEYPLLTLLEAAKPENVKKIVRSDIQVIASFEVQYYLPSSITAIKEAVESEKDTMVPGETRSWHLSTHNIGDILYLIDSNLKEDAIHKNIRSKLLNIPIKEPHVKIKEEARETVYKCVLTDASESIDLDIQKAEYIAYSLNKKLQTGGKYRVTYRLVPHPYDGQKLTMIILDIEDINDSVTQFTINEQKITLLRQFQVQPNISLDQKIDELIERAKGIIGEDRNNLLIKLIDFWYHTPLEMQVGNRIMRAYLDMMIIGESRIGKSSTFIALQNMYQLGSRVDFGGGNATRAGIIGGTTQIGGAHKTRAGLLARSHKGAVCFEEIARASSDIIKDLTEIRSSGEIKLQRVDGEMRLPAKVRMLSLTNTKETDGMPRSLMSYPHGISIITDLIPSAADIARYDVIAILYDQGAKYIDPFFTPKEPFSKEAYQTRIRWIWSRKPEQIVISKEIYTYLINQCNELNKEYDTHIKIFGVELWQKILRLAVAIAGYVVSTDDSFEQIIVKQEHIDYAIHLFVSLYDNQHFRFKQYVTEQRLYSTIDEEGIELLQRLYNKNASILIHLETNSSTTSRTLQTISGMEFEEFSVFMNQLTNGLFIRHEGYNIIPTERFRLGMTRINRKTKIQPIGVKTIGISN